MRPLKSTLPADALTTLRTLLTQTKEARIFRRVQAVQAVVAGTPITTVASTLHFTDSALRKWVQRFAAQGVLGFRDRPRAGRPAKVTPEVTTRLTELIKQDPLQHGALSSQWSCRELATTITHETGVQVGRESVRRALKKSRKVLSPHWTSRAESRRPGVWADGTRRAGVSGPTWGDHSPL